jgi:hypothetical protein
VATLANAVQYVGAAKANLAWVALRDGREAEAEELGKAALGCWAPLANAYAFKWQAVWPLLWLALQRDDLAETTALAEQLLVHSQQLPAPSCARYSSRQNETTAWTRAEPAVCTTGRRTGPRGRILVGDMAP